MEMLFPEQIIDSGFRLAYLEIYNWGGFHERIWRIKPDCESILITGANGSGKTTLADALVTLLVPPVRRHYNQSSGSERKRDRTEETYVLGAYGSIRNDDAGRSAVSNLRDKSCYSILVAGFSNNLNNASFCLAQIRWFSASGLQREYITADAPLHIQEHLQPLDAKREYRKRLGSIPGIAWHDSFAKYQQYLIRALGLRSEKALNLFSQIVGVKQIENLNVFIRTHMIEEPGMEEDFHKLKGNYQDLLQTHNKIEMAEKQLEFLTEIKENGEKYRTIQKEREQLHSISQGIPFFFAARIQEKAEEFHAEQSSLLERHLSEKGRIEQEKEKTARELESVNTAIARDSTSGRLREIENNLSGARERIQELKKRHSQYIRCSESLGLPAPVSADVFNTNRSTVQTLIKKKENQVKEAERDLRNIERKQEDQESISSELEKEIKSLRDRRSNIPSKVLHLRRQLCDALEAAPAELPFAGELIQIREDERRWEQAAEKLLHSFALSVLVPEGLYQQATTYINSTDLKGRLIYYRIPDSRSKFQSGTREELFTPEPATLPAKLEVRPDTPFSSWLASTLLDRFDYLCTDDLKEFSHTTYAVTSRGLVKGRRKHEKDDRPGRWDRDRYVLGWDNSRKIAFLQEQHRNTGAILEELKKSVNKSQQTIAGLRDRIESGRTIVALEQYSEIDWAELAERIGDLEAQKTSLLQSADALRALEAKKGELEEARRKMEEKRDNLLEDIALCKQKISSLKEQIKTSLALLEELDETQRSELDSVSPFIEKLLTRKKTEGFDPIERIKSQQIAVMEENRSNIENTVKKIDKVSRDLINAMNRFLFPGAELARSFPGWSSDTHHLSANPDFLDDFISVHDRIQKDDLPKYKKDFRKFMNERMFENIISFSNTLDLTEKKIKEDIGNLNRSLISVRYSRLPETYIRLDTRAARDVSVQEFRALLRSSMGNARQTGSGGENSEVELEASFIRIQELISKLSEDDTWRKKVLDVRNWLEFGAIELYRDNDEQKQYYEDSMSLSGGEKAKLAYTILASAVAYQYGLNREQHEQTGRSFRFIIVDEIFSKVDPENSEFAMDLFKTMGLQLMIITPLDRINIVEKHIGSVCFIEKQKEYAVPHHLSIENYREMQAMNQ
ncbi:hypothetical protein B4O97_14135 [Marispirochaeta aestuarii]|uniref:Uncharacterized protein n=1 Tax=Marispirochaeta aestuarii TaxID=1963862 RepID=A0A1Y1RVH6_9SPIO|nr:SbcC/MukB-like Walker B domain-containing protein [Marispirochaeta aestuarii]ORC34023.1 hypothetical protein B4O97_14135 [Marispirochaeta aestuarii]